MNTLKILTQARDLLSDIEHWTQDSYAIDNTGCECKVGEDFAHSFCAVGALARVCGVDVDKIQQTPPYKTLQAAVLELSGKPQIADWNDGEEYEKAHRRVLRAYRLAIKKAKAKV